VSTNRGYNENGNGKTPTPTIFDIPELARGEESRLQDPLKMKVEESSELGRSPKIVKEEDEGACTIGRQQIIIAAIHRRVKQKSFRLTHCNVQSEYVRANTMQQPTIALFRH